MLGGTNYRSLLSKMSASIWQDADMCKQEEYLKKQWFVRNGQETNKEAKFTRPVLYIVVEGVKKKKVSFGPIVQAAVTPFFVGKGKAKEQREGLSFLSLCKDQGFKSIILNPTEMNIGVMKNFSEDVICKEVIPLFEGGQFQNIWFQNFINDCEPTLLPMVEAEYLVRAGTTWTDPMRLKLKHKSNSTTPTSST
jgi:hypothetical protein